MKGAGKFAKKISLYSKRLRRGKNEKGKTNKTKKRAGNRRKRSLQGGNC
jgi:hypothetical protein